MSWGDFPYNQSPRGVFTIAGVLAKQDVVITVTGTEHSVDPNLNSSRL